jgi:dolichol-phosphate mannosyltransferase
MPLSDPPTVLDGDTDQPRNSVALVIPVYNEEEVLPMLIEELEAFRADREYIRQVILVDDGSSDRSARRIRDLTAGKSGYCMISFSRNFGHQLAVTAGLHAVDADAAVILDADLQDPLSVIDEMVERWREGYEVVYGVRRERRGESWFKRATANIFYRVFQWAADVDMPLNAGDFRLVSRRVIDAYRKFQEQEPFVRGLISWIGFEQTGVLYDREPRAAGRSKYSLGKMMRLAWQSLTAFSTKLLRVAVRIGFGTAVLSLLGLVWVLIVKYALGSAITGWASLIFVGFFFGGVQLFFLGVVGEYLARVYKEVKARPRYILEDTWYSDHSRDPREDPEMPSTRVEDGA